MVSNYQFEDAVEQILLFEPDATDAELVEEVVSLAAEYGLVVAADAVTVHQRAADRMIDITYTTDVAFIPGLITRPVTFKPSASARLLTKRR